MSIPDHAIGCIGSSLSATYLRLTFARLDHLLQIYAPPIPLFSGETDGNKAITYNKQTRELIELHRDIVETLIDTIDFMSVESAIMVPQSHGGFALVPKTQVDLYTIQCRPWVSLIDMREVRTTHWCPDSQTGVRRGLWRGLEIEFYVATESGIRWAVQHYADLLQVMNTSGLNLCSPLVGHLVKDGSVIGVATEFHTELATYADRALLYDAFQLLERQNIFFKIELFPNSIYISDGKVQFGYMCASRLLMCTGRETGTFLEQARQQHWDYLDDYLSKLQDIALSNYMLIRWDEQFRILAYIPNPERPLLDITLDVQTRSKWVKHRRLKNGQSRVLLLHGETNHVFPFPSSYHNDAALSAARAGMYEIEDDTPLPRAHIELGTRPVRHRHAFDPYRRGSTHMRFRSGWDGDSDVTSEATPSIVELSPSD